MNDQKSKKTKCSTGVSSVLTAGALADSTAGGPMTTGTDSGALGANNASALATSLPYSRSKKKCTKTSTIYNGGQTGTSAPSNNGGGNNKQQNANNNSPVTPNPGNGNGQGPYNAGGPNSSASLAANALNSTASGTPGGNDNGGNGGTSPSSAGVLNSAASGTPGGTDNQNAVNNSAGNNCPAQQTVTVTNAFTVTVTAPPGGPATGAIGLGANQNSAMSNGPASSKKKCTKTKGTGASTGALPQGTGGLLGNGTGAYQRPKLV